VTRVEVREWAPGERQLAAVASGLAAEGAQPIEAPGGWRIVPQPRPEVVEGIDEQWWPILKHDTKGFHTDLLFGPFYASI